MRHLRWQNRILAGWLVVFGLLILLALPTAIPTTIVPPAEVRDPVTVTLIDHGRTPSLVLPDSGRAGVRWAFGDWNYYALERRGFTTTLAALLWPTTGTLGQQPLPGEHPLADETGLWVEGVHPIVVERQSAERLLEQLRRDYDLRRDRAVFNPNSKMHFVPHPRRYTYFYNSNHAVADWLRELGCETRGPAFNSNWRLVD